jgi:hypothetical protein
MVISNGPKVATVASPDYAFFSAFRTAFCFAFFSVYCSS